MRLRQLTGLMQDQLHAEYEEIMKQIAYLESILCARSLALRRSNSVRRITTS